MPRPFAVAGFTVFLTILFLADTTTGVMITAFFAFFIALVIALLIKASREGRVFPLSMLSGALACVLLVSFNHFVYEPVIAYEGEEAYITARITDFPEIRYGNFYCQAEIITLDGVNTDLKVRLVFQEMPDVQPYDMVEGRVKFYRPGNSAEEFLSANKAKGIYLGAYFNDYAEKFTVHNIDESQKPFMYHIVMFREGIKKAVYRALPDECGNLAVALLIGDKSAIGDELYEELTDAGFIHLICVSGFHLSFWANVIICFLRKLRLGIRTSSVIAAVGVIAFMFVAGFSASVVRSGIMTLVYLASNVLSRKSDSINSLGFALLVMALINPLSLCGIGLQLSALATLGIILYSNYYAPKIDAFFNKFKYKYPALLLKHVISSLLLTAGALLLIQPVSLMQFGNFSFVAIISNVLVTWAGGAAIVLSALAAVLSFIVSFKYNFAAALSRLFLRYLLFVAKAFSSFSELMFRVESDKASFILALVFMLCAVAVIFAYKGYAKSVLSMVLCFSLFASCVITSSYCEKNITRARVIDNGNAISVCITKNGESVLIGCGGGYFDSGYIISKALEEETDSVNAMFIPDSSPFTSAESVGIIKNFKPENVYADSLSPDAELVAAGRNLKAFDDKYIGDNITVTSFKGESGACSFVETDDVSFLILYSPVASLNGIPVDFNEADVLIARGNYPKGDELSSVSLTVVSAENLRGVAIQNELEAKGFKGIATADCGDILIRAREGSISANRI